MSNRRVKVSEFEKKHIFLTGDIQIGKSTAIRHFLDRMEDSRPELKRGGFRTVADYLEDGTSTVHIVSPAGEPELNDNNMIMRRFSKGPGKKRPELYLDVFETAGAELLKEAASCDYILMDEIGFAESRSYAFLEEIFKLLDGDIPIIGVTRKQDLDILNKVREHSRVISLEVTEENRDRIGEALKWDEEHRWIVLEGGTESI